MSYQEKHSDIDFLQNKIGWWAKKTFGHTQAHLAAIIAHLEEEVRELKERGTAEETADIFILLCTVAHLCNFSLHDAVLKKHEINLKRKWKPPDERGVVHHE